MQFLYPLASAALRIIALDFGVPDGRKYAWVLPVAFFSAAFPSEISLVA